MICALDFVVIRAFDSVSLVVFAREASCSACFFSFLAHAKIYRGVCRRHRREARRMRSIAARPM